MKTCEACKGTGQIEEPFQLGDVIEVIGNPYWAGLGVVVDAKLPCSVVMFTGSAKGQQGAFYGYDLRVCHGHISLDLA